MIEEEYPDDETDQNKRKREHDTFTFQSGLYFSPAKPCCFHGGLVKNSIIYSVGHVKTYPMMRNGKVVYKIT